MLTTRSGGSTQHPSDRDAGSHGRPLEDDRHWSAASSAVRSTAGGMPFVLELEQSLYCAFRLEYVVGMSVLGLTDDSLLPGLARRHAEFVTCLINGRDCRFVYDLRYLACPSSEPTSYGTAQLCLLVRGDGISGDDLDRHAVGLGNLLDAQFGEYRFSRVPATDILLLLEPFPVRFLTSIGRRWTFERLDTLTGGVVHPGPGFSSGAPAATRADDVAGEVVHLYPFVPVHRPMRALLQAMIALPHPVALSIRLIPTKIDANEEGFLEEQIAVCERYSQISLGMASEDVSHLRPTLRRQAATLQEFGARLLFGLRDNAALMTIEIAAPEAVPRPLLELVGAAITQPAGGFDRRPGSSIEAYLAGGYELVEWAPTTARVRAFVRPTVVPDAATGLPSGAYRLRHLFDSLEAAAAFRFPPTAVDELPGLELRMWRPLAPPRGLPKQGVVVGVTSLNYRSALVRLSAEDRKRHAYIIGQSGTGKTTALRTMVLDDIESGLGVCVIDPHGDLFLDILGRIPAHRRNDVVVVDPSDSEWPVGLNPIEAASESQSYFLAEEFCGIITRLLQDEFGAASMGQFAGPVFFQHLRMNLLLLMSDPAKPGTLLDLHTIFNKRDFYRNWLPLRSTDPVLQRWVENVLPKTDYLKPGQDSPSMGSYIGSKLENFVFEPRLRNIFAQRRSTIDLRQVMDTGKILLVNLAKGLLTEPTSRFFGMLLLSRLIAAILSRVDQDVADRRPFTLYVDEFQSLATEGFVTLLSEARKFGVQIVLANQFVSQIHNRRITDAVFGNVGTLMCFRMGQADAELLEPYLRPEVSRQDLVRLPNWQAYLSTLIGGAKAPVFSVKTIADVAPFSDEVAVGVREDARARYSIARKSAEVLCVPVEDVTPKVTTAERH